MRVTNQIFVGVALALLVTGWQSDAGNYFEVRSSDSRVTFTISKWTVFKQEGRFTDFSGRINYHAEDPSELHVQFSVVVESVETHNNTRNRRIQGEDFFDSGQYPTMDFESTSVEEADDGMLKVAGDLTIKGVTRPIVIPVRPLGITDVPDLGTIAGFETSFTLDRTDYGVTGHRWSGGKNILGQEVEIHILVSAQRRK